MSTMVAELNALHAEVDALKRLQAETAAELDALLPSILDRAFRRVIVSKDEPRRVVTLYLDRTMRGKL